MTNIVLCGIGGQGTVLASKLLAAAGMKKGYTVQSAETIGMAQRGGSVFSHLRMGAADEEVSSPMIALGTADILIGFEPGETVRLLPYLKPDGQVITASRSVMPVTAALTGGSYDGADMLRYLEDNVQNLSVVDTETALAELGNPKVTNVLLLGYAAESGALGLTAEDLKDALKERLPEKLWDVNFRALDYAKKA
ncbi:MAG: indolepyruvate oxidoreductase subunit beta [Eubacteriales bacterium]|nr:indolepyruvate oxidoreductase subunit beta [Eubacteriales bacterium]